MDPKVVRRQFLKAIDNQLAANNPPEARQTLNRLIQEGYSHDEAVQFLAACIATEFYQVVKFQRPYDNQKYISYLHNLPNMPWEMEE